MLGLTDFITEKPWIDTFTIWYVLIDDAYQSLVGQVGRLRCRGPQPSFTDSEVITVTLIIESFFHGNEELGLAFLRQYHQDLFPDMVENSRFNRRRRQLTGVMEVIRRQLTTWLIDKDDSVRLLDSAPLPTCTYTRGGSCDTVKGPEYVGYVASKRANFFGLRLFLTTSLDQVVDRWMLAPASHRDGKVTPSFFDETTQLWVYADNAFHDPDNKAWLEKQRRVILVTGQRRDAKNRWPTHVRRLFNRLRRRIETALSTLCTVFHLQRLGSRSLSGLLCRVTTRILAYNLSFLTNVEFMALEN